MARRSGDRIETVANEDPTVLLVEATKMANRMGLDGFKVDDWDVGHDEENRANVAVLHGYTLAPRTVEDALRDLRSREESYVIIDGSRFDLPDDLTEGVTLPNGWTIGGPKR